MDMGFAPLSGSLQRFRSLRLSLVQEAHYDIGRKHGNNLTVLLRSEHCHVAQRWYR